MREAHSEGEEGRHGEGGEGPLGGQPRGRGRGEARLVLVAVGDVGLQVSLGEVAATTPLVVIPIYSQH